MRDGREVSIISFVRMCHGAIGERSHNNAGLEVARRDSCFLRPALCSGKVDHQATWFQEGARYYRTNGIQDVDFGLFQHWLRQSGRIHLRNVSAKSSSYV